MWTEQQLRRNMCIVTYAQHSSLADVLFAKPRSDLNDLGQRHRSRASTDQALTITSENIS